MRNYSKPDLIIENSNPLNLGFPTLFFSMKHDVPYILDQMDIWPEFIFKNTPFPINIFLIFFSLPLLFFRIFYYKNSSAYISLSQNYLDFAKKIYSKTITLDSVIYNGIDLLNFQNYLQPQNKSNLISKSPQYTYLIFAGTLGNSYDIKTIIKVADIIQKDSIKIKILIAGSGPYSSLVISASHYNSNLIYLGALKPKDLISVYSICDVGLCSYSRKSNVDMPDKFYDYISAGLAIINSLNGEIKDIINLHKLGLNYTPGDINSLFSCIKLMYKNNLIDQFKKNSSRLSTTFDINKQIYKLNLVINEVTKW
jgi:glycosyltransferase involved in cell wall biosynthesis